ncbi:hypothetical protein [Halobellus sp. EA9]|uniref:hypothetical protein n=1 Tax=Halobellus sp. EA9 TaxID=3421647 RepID=UPI003EBD76DC
MSGTVNSEYFDINYILLAAVPILLAAIHFLTPGTFQQALAFDHTRFKGYTLLTAAYVHASDAHLYNNLIGYALAATYTYALCLTVDELSWFRYTFLIHLLTLPILVNLISYAIFATLYPEAEPVSRGFSGVVSGLVGFLLVALYVFVRKRHSREVGYATGLITLLLLMQLIDLRYAGNFRPVVMGLIALASLLVLSPYFRGGIEFPDKEKRKYTGLSIGAVAVVSFILAYLILKLFPEAGAIIKDGAFTNIFAHAAGFLWGILVSIGVWVYCSYRPVG